MIKPPQELIDKFMEWFRNDNHSANEDHYKDTITAEHLSLMSKSDFIDFFTEFAADGGMIQSGGHRTKNLFRATISDQYDSFRSFILGAFKPDFSLDEWLQNTNDFKYFGAGLATIYLNRIDKKRFSIVNDKTKDSLALFGIKLPTNLERKYNEVNKSQQQLISWFPEINNFYRADALNQFLVGTDEGAKLAKQFLGRRYWVCGLGEGAKYWNECQDNKIAVFGFDKLPNLLQFKSKKDIENALIKARGMKKRPTNDALAAWQVANEIKEGDILIAKRGSKTYLGYGVVNGAYRYDSARESYRNIIPVSWEKIGEWQETEGQIALKTLTDITPHPDYVQRLISMMDIKPGGEDNEDISNDLKAFNRIYYGPPGTGKTYKLQKLFTDYGNRFDFITFHQSYSYEEFIEGIRPVMDDPEGTENGIAYRIEDGIFKKIARRAADDLENQYALFIDEINRGNISKIFGELITLIELDKRIDPQNPIQGMRVTLPYSKKPFGVPKNLSIIGTMNTADRSIALVDIALRRRFEFKEMMPTEDLIDKLLSQDVGGVNVGNLLKKINQRIEYLYDRDHVIGHAYLMNIESIDKLRLAFLNKIIPLLQEYFYGDWKKICLVLGCPVNESGTQNNADSAMIKAENKGLGYLPQEYEEKPTFRIHGDFENPDFTELKKFFDAVIKGSGNSE